MGRNYHDVICLYQYLRRLIARDQGRILRVTLVTYQSGRRDFLDSIASSVRVLACSFSMIRLT